MTEADLAAYTRHSRWTDPGEFAALLDAVPADPARLPEIVGGLILHPLFAGTETRRNADASLRGAAEIVGALLERDPRPLEMVRQPEKRALGTCRNYSLLACAVLRQHCVPARLRVGFADYFTAGFREDHWVSEYHDGERWRLLDPELTPDVRRGFGIGFDPADVPRDRFLAAGPAWLALRGGTRDPAKFGVSALGIRGLWFAASSLLRDLAALNRQEMMPWDFWGPARDFRPGGDIPPDWFARLDRLADALAGLDAGREDAGSILAEHSWAALQGTVLSFPQGTPIEVTLV